MRRRSDKERRGMFARLSERVLRKPLYHGTSLFAAKRIARDGLKMGCAPIHTESSYGCGHVGVSKARGFDFGVFLTPSFDTAVAYAYDASKQAEEPEDVDYTSPNFGDMAVVVVKELPDDVRVKPDGYGDVMTNKEIPASMLEVISPKDIAKRLGVRKLRDYYDAKAQSKAVDKVLEGFIKQKKISPRSYDGRELSEVYTAERELRDLRIYPHNEAYTYDVGALRGAWIFGAGVLEFMRAGDKWSIEGEAISDEKHKSEVYRERFDKEVGGKVKAEDCRIYDIHAHTREEDTIDDDHLHFKCDGEGRENFKVALVAVSSFIENLNNWGGRA